MNNFKHLVSADFLVSAVNDFIDLRKQYQREWFNDARNGLIEELLDHVEQYGVGDATSPSWIVDNFLINGDFISRSDFPEYQDLQSWLDYVSHNAIIYNDDFACLSF